MKLQKLLYYSQAWTLTWDAQPLFQERIEAWPDGPVVRELWGLEKHFGVRDGDASALSVSEQENVREVLRVYGAKSGDWLSALSHREVPWCAARRGCAPNEQSQAAITPDALRAYFCGIPTPRKHLTPDLVRGMNLLTSIPPDEVDGLLDEADESLEELRRSIAS